MTDEAQAGESPESAIEPAAAHARELGAGDAGAIAVSAEDAGSLLKAWREQAGLSTAEVAGRLKLSQRQIDAMERNDWSSFASPSLLKGFVRAYARILQGDEAAVLALLPSAIDPGKSLTLEPTLSAPMPQSHLRSNATWWLRSGLVGVIAIGVAVAVGKFGWIPFAAAPEAPVAAANPTAPVVEAALPVLPPGTEANPSTAGSVPDPANAGAQAASPDALVAAPGASAPGALGSGGTAPSAPGTAPAAAMASAPTAPAPTVTVPPAPVAGAPMLRINVQNESWIEITDAAGRVLLSAVQPAGAQQDLNGRAPFTIVVGNAPGVHIEYGGKPVDLAPYTRGNVARFALN